MQGSIGHAYLALAGCWLYISDGGSSPPLHLYPNYYNPMHQADESDECGSVSHIYITLIDLCLASYPPFN